MTPSLKMTGALALVCSLTLGCEQSRPSPAEKPKDTTPAAADLGTTAAPDKSSDAAGTPTDAASAIAKLASSCKFDDKLTPRVCEGYSKVAFDKLINTQRLEALPALVDALESQDVTRKNAAGYTFQRLMPYIIVDAVKLDKPLGFGEEPPPPKLDKPLIERLLAATKALAKDEDAAVASAVIRVAVEAGTMLDMDAAVRDVLAAYDPDKNEKHAWPKYYGVRSAMKYGRMSFFPEAKAALDSNHKQLKLAAFEAPNQMKKWTDPESKEICGWAASLIKEDDSKWNAGPARLLLRCNDAVNMRTTLLDEATRRFNDGRYGRPFAFAMSTVCAPSVWEVTPNPPKTICIRAELLLKKIIESDKIKPRERAYAVTSYVKQFASAETLKYLQELTKSKEPLVAKAAKAELAKIDRKNSPSKRRGALEKSKKAKAPTPSKKPETNKK